MDQQLELLTTERVNPRSESIDTLSPIELVRLFNREDAMIADAVGKEEAAIAQAIEIISDRIRSGGRLVYVGAGTSGRLGVLDASECPPTFSTPPEMVIGLIAGGDSALRRAAEGIEDLPERGADDLRQIGFCKGDVLVGIASSGRTPYVIGAVAYARSLGASTIGLACNENSPLAEAAEWMITPVVGPELISGSTRMKAGTATKMVLNMLTTGTMVRLGKTYGNLMVDLRASNAKLVARTRRLMSRLTGLSNEESQAVLDRCDGELKTAIVSARCSVSAIQARERLRQSGGQLRLALESGQK
ncbi:N-acetylmuramic acid 6-phosphate etherase [Rhodopirellula sp. MGV]|nr:N-acetylmuramic acid 6-phosphate etherase [Rhodopirellula sp. MGV]PNY34450.1 N-acetylmuramic acid 6-phosphate etherase [Rhodopirellula baltica]